MLRCLLAEVIIVYIGHIMKRLRITSLSISTFYAVNVTDLKSKHYFTKVKWSLDVYKW